MMKKKNLLYICIAIFVVPILVNYVLTREIICNYDVAGTGVDWINFYGSFLGSALSALVAYYVLLKTIENDTRENIKKYKRDEYEQLRDDISERIGQIEVMEVYRCLCYPKNFKVKDEIDRLTSLLFLYKSRSNSFTLKYGLETDEVCVDFYHEYNQLMIEICKCIKGLIEALSKYIELDNDNLKVEERDILQQAMWKNISDQRSIMNRVNSMPPMVFDKAQRYCKKIKKQLDELYS